MCPLLLPVLPVICMHVYVLYGDNCCRAIQGAELSKAYLVACILAFSLALGCLCY